ncbi:MAG: hypothetical protein ACHREM_27730 [Polyangiales bacterium]
MSGDDQPEILVDALLVDEPVLTADIVEDEAALAEIVEVWAATQVLPWRDDIQCIEAALRESLDPGLYRLLDRLLGLVRAAADERLVRGVRWGFEQGRPASGAGEGAS